MPPDTPTASRLSCSDHSFPALERLRPRLEVVRLLGFHFVDVSLFDELAVFERNADEYADEIRRALADSDLGCPDLFFAPGASFEDIAPNARLSEDRRRRRKAFARALDIASELEVPGVTILPGVVWEEEPKSGWECCVEELAWRLESARTRGIELRIEPHVGSIVSMPEAVDALLAELVGLRLTYDQAHFDAQSVEFARLAKLAPAVGHVHVRGSKSGAMQVRWRDNESDVTGLIEVLSEANYQGKFSIEYVVADKWRCNELDVLSETAAARDGLKELGIT